MFVALLIAHGYSLILVELRKLLHFMENFKLIDILQLFQGMIGDTTSPEVLSNAIHRNLGRGVLLILDGFDELPSHLRQSDFLVNLLSLAMVSVVIVGILRFSLIF